MCAFIYQRKFNSFFFCQNLIKASEKIDNFDIFQLSVVICYFLAPNCCLWIFVCCDFLSLLISCFRWVIKTNTCWWMQVISDILFRVNLRMFCVGCEILQLILVAHFSGDVELCTTTMMMKILIWICCEIIFNYNTHLSFSWVYSKRK